MPPRKSSSSAEKKTDEPAKAGGGQEEQYAKLIVGLAENAPEKVRPYLIQAAPILAKLWLFCVLAMPYIGKAIQKADEIIAVMPVRILRAIVGFCVCFFGGVFPLTIAAVEAWKMCGGDQAMASIKELRGEAAKVLEANKKDDEVDADGDGVADVKQINAHDLAMRKTKMVLKVVTPEIISNNLSLLYTGWVGVIATLKIQFAKTIALGAAIGARLYDPAEKYLQPMIMKMVPEEYQKWVPWGVRWGCKAIAVWVAWWVQRIISAFHSAIRGGLMCGKELVNFAHDKGYIKASDEETYMDEIVGWSLALLGLITQFMLGFSIPFPLNILLTPIYLVEGFIAWSIY